MPVPKKNLKDEQRAHILRKYGLPPKVRSLILLDITDPDMKKWLTEGAQSISLGVVVAAGTIEEKGEYAGYDAVVTDLKSGCIDMISLIQNGVVPILPKDNDFSSNFSEFDPMKFTGNAFLYEKIEPYHIFEKMVRYLENIRYAGDKRTLMQNLEKTF